MAIFPRALPASRWRIGAGPTATTVPAAWRPATGLGYDFGNEFEFGLTVILDALAGRVRRRVS